MSLLSRNPPERPAVRTAVRVALGVATLAAAALLSGKAHAGNWDFIPRVEVGAEYNDNYRMNPSTQPKVPAYGSIVDLSMTERLIDPRYEIDIAPHIRNTEFPNDHRDQSTDGYLDLSGQYHFQRATVGALFSYANETVLASELLNADFTTTPGNGLGQTSGEETGLVTFHNRRELVRFAPNYKFDFTERVHLKAEGQYENASFGQNFSTQQAGSNLLLVQEGFKDYYGKAGIQYDFSRRYDLVSSLVGAKFLPDGRSTTTTRYGLEESFEARPSQIMAWYVRAGVNQVHALTSVNGAINKTLAVGGAGAAWTYQLSQYAVDIIRDLSASAGGAVVSHNEARGRVLKAWQPRLYSVFAARYVRVRGASQDILGIAGSDYAAASATLQYEFTRSWRVSGEYDYTWQHFQNEPRSRSNGIQVSVIWQPLSRYNPLPNYEQLQLDKGR